MPVCSRIDLRTVNCALLGCLIAAIALALPACGGGGNATPTGNDALVQEWKELSKAGFQGLNARRGQEITAELAKSGTAGLSPILDALGDPQGDPVAKVLAVMCLTQYISPDMAPRLLEMTREGQETTSRACAAHLLGFVQTPEAKQRMKELALDKERRVMMEASLALLMNGDPDTLKRVPELWNDKETTERERTQLINVLPEAHARECLDIVKAAAQNADLEMPARIKAVTILGRIGDASVLDALNACAEKDPFPEIKSLAANAAEAVKARTQAPAAPPATPPSS